MAYKVLDILKDLPGTNCGDCAKKGCFAFATGVYLDGLKLSLCPHLNPEKLAMMEEKLDAGRGAGEGRKEASHVQALAFLKKKIAGCDFAAMAEKASATLLPGEEPGLKLDFMGRGFVVTAGDVVAVEGEAPSVWVKVFLCIYVTRAAGNEPAGEWAAFRELPNTVSKAKTYEAKVSEIAEHFGDDLESLDRAALSIGGEPAAFGSADRAWRFKALPRVDVMLLYWRGAEEFCARSTLLVDRGVLDYLDQEALVFLAEAFVKMMTGGDVAEVIP